ncbi:tRNA methyltransferase 10 C [Tyrophagus putrescentiae]|nr:tRNA methyltransferase 10 C [Tyrophagus putrescentiae]
MLRVLCSSLFQRSPPLTRCFHQVPCRRLATKKYDPLLVEQIRKKLDDEKTFENFYVDDFADIYANDQSKKAKIEKIIYMYDNMKYNLENVPTTLSKGDMNRLLEMESSSDIKRLLNKMQSKELEYLIRKELKKTAQAEKSKEDDTSFERSGLFGADGDLKYGLWHNTLFTRIPRNYRSRFSLTRHQSVELFGQNLILDLSFSKHLNYHLSSHVANDLGNMLSFNRHSLQDPFKISLCGVDYEHPLWKALYKSFHSTLDFIHHTESSYLDLCSERSNLVYITSLEKKFSLEYDPNATYIMAAVSEKDMQTDFITPKLKKLNITRQGIPIDKHILWNQGSKRLNLNTKLKILNDIRSNKEWKEILLEYLHPDNIKTKEQIMSEDIYRSRFYRKVPLQ